jgi:hypothetical protein
MPKTEGGFKAIRSGPGYKSGRHAPFHQGVFWKRIRQEQHNLHDPKGTALDYPAKAKGGHHKAYRSSHEKHFTNNE